MPTQNQLNNFMKKLKEGNVYNVETSKMKPNRSEELKDVSNIMMQQFWDSMSRQNINPELAKQIAKHTFADSDNIQSS